MFSFHCVSVPRQRRIPFHFTADLEVKVVLQQRVFLNGWMYFFFSWDIWLTWPKKKTFLKNIKQSSKRLQKNPKVSLKLCSWKINVFVSFVAFSEWASSHWAAFRRCNLGDTTLIVFSDSNIKQTNHSRKTFSAKCTQQSTQNNTCFGNKEVCRALPARMKRWNTNTAGFILANKASRGKREAAWRPPEN